LTSTGRPSRRERSAASAKYSASSASCGGLGLSIRPETWAMKLSISAAYAAAKRSKKFGYGGAAG